MPAYTNPKRIFKYSDEFKLKAVQWSFDPQRSVKDVATALRITSYNVCYTKLLRPGMDGLFDKITYSEGFEAWGYGIGTGIYIDEVETLYRKKLIDMGIIGGGIFIVVLGGLLLISRSISKPLFDIRNNFV